LGWKSILCLYLASLLLAVPVAPPVLRFLLWENARMPNRATAYVLSRGFGLLYDRLHLFFFALMLFVAGLRAWWTQRSSPAPMDTHNSMARRRGTSPLSLFGKFFAIGVAMVFFLMALQLWCFPFRCAPWTAALTGWMTWYGLSAGGIALLEETFFRGCLLGSLWRCWGGPRAICLSAAIFAGAHFGVSRSWDLPPEAVTALSGFRALGNHLFGVFQSFEFLPFAILLLLGVVLAQLALLYRSLAPAMGLHAGVVWTLMLYKKCVDLDLKSPHPFLGTWRLTDAPATLGLLSLLSYWLHRRAAPKNAPAA